MQLKMLRKRWRCPSGFARCFLQAHCQHRSALGPARHRTTAAVMATLARAQLPRRHRQERCLSEVAWRLVAAAMAHCQGAEGLISRLAARMVLASTGVAAPQTEWRSVLQMARCPGPRSELHKHNTQNAIRLQRPAGTASVPLIWCAADRWASGGALACGDGVDRQSLQEVGVTVGLFDLLHKGSRGIMASRFERLRTGEQQQGPL
jgi:hypothetical protein